jgi:hypothetical protein
VAICELRAELDAWPELSRTEDDVRWARELEARGVTEADYDLYLDGEWRIVTAEGEHFIAPPELDREGFVTWRW